MGQGRDRVVVVGRAPDCDVLMHDPSISSRHARLRWEGSLVVVEDLGSANGVFVAGRRVTSARVRPGDDVLLGGTSLPWSDPKLAGFLRSGAKGDTVHATMMGRAYICGRCGARGFLPRGIKRVEILCSSCHTMLEIGAPPPTLARRLGTAAAVFVGVLVLAGATIVGRERIATVLRELGKDSGIVSIPLAGWEPPSGSPEESAIRGSGVRDRVVGAIDPTSAITRTLAARIAAEDEGPFHVGQVAAIWRHAREHWSYVNEPRGDEYFARASETITNGYVGDCDDFAILLVSMTEAIGGDARVVMSDGERGGHAYAEVCIQGEPERVVTDLRAHYRRERQRTRIPEVHFRSDPTCPVWLNLDWNAQTPGGPYGAERWAVAIHPDGKTETLAPASE
jgi:hypothetical protein